MISWWSSFPSAAIEWVFSSNEKVYMWNHQGRNVMVKYRKHQWNQSLLTIKERLYGDSFGLHLWQSLHFGWYGFYSQPSFFHIFLSPTKAMKAKISISQPLQVWGSFDSATQGGQGEGCAGPITATSSSSALENGCVHLCNRRSFNHEVTAETKPTKNDEQNSESGSIVSLLGSCIILRLPLGETNNT